MTAMQQQVMVVTPTIHDPNSVPEVLANGPINMNGMGNFATLTFTQIRPDVGQLFKGKVNPQDFSAVVVSRITLPVETLLQLKKMLDSAVIQTTPPVVSTLKQ